MGVSGVLGRRCPACLLGEAGEGAHGPQGALRRGCLVCMQGCVHAGGVRVGLGYHGLVAFHDEVCVRGALSLNGQTRALTTHRHAHARKSNPKGRAP